MSSIGGAGGGADMRVRRMPKPSIMACTQHTQHEAWLQQRHQRKESRRTCCKRRLPEGRLQTRRTAWLSALPFSAAGSRRSRSLQLCCSMGLPASQVASQYCSGGSQNNNTCQDWRLTLCRTATSVQSNVENRPPHTAKLPPSLGASLRIACRHQNTMQLLETRITRVPGLPKA